jgi:hypothetical protein
MKFEAQYKVKISNRFADLENLNDKKVINMASEIRGSTAKLPSKRIYGIRT